MTGTGQPEAGSDSRQGQQPSGFGYCSWHQSHSRGVRLIQVEEAGSGPCTAASRYACHSCRQAYDLVLFADRPL